MVSSAGGSPSWTRVTSELDTFVLVANLGLHVASQGWMVGQNELLPVLVRPMASFVGDRRRLLLFGWMGMSETASGCKYLDWSRNRLLSRLVPLRRSPVPAGEMLFAIGFTSRLRVFGHLFIGILLEAVGHCLSPRRKLSLWIYFGSSRGFGVSCT